MNSHLKELVKTVSKRELRNLVVVRWKCGRLEVASRKHNVYHCYVHPDLRKLREVHMIKQVLCGVGATTNPHYIHMMWNDGTNTRIRLQDL